MVTSELKGVEYAGFRTISKRPRLEDAEQVLKDSLVETEYAVKEDYRAFFDMLAKKDAELVRKNKWAH